MKVREIPLSDRPYERLIKYGSNILSNEELLAILIKSGTKENSSKMISSKIISNLNDISELKNFEYHDLIKIKGIKQAKACNILAAIELGKRISKKSKEQEKIKVINSKIVYEYYKDLLENKNQEYFYCLFLDNKKYIKKSKLIFLGTINYSVVHPREIFKEAYIIGATSIICVHNHPTGDVNPSNQDIITTQNLIKVGQILDIKIDDHIIIGNNNYYSFFENGKMY